jgi:hypothetical protein
MKLILLFFVLIISTACFSQNDDWKFTGHLQLRSELDGRDFSNTTPPITFASLRTRVAVEKSFLNKLNFFVQFQDSRIFGEERGTLASINNIDLHQGYVMLKEPFDWRMEIQAGRFEVAYGTERFFGAVGWHYVGRSWDGVRFKFPSIGLDAFALTHSDYAMYIGNAVPAIYSGNAYSSYSVYGVWEQAKLDEKNKLDVFGYYQINRMKLLSDNSLLSRFTVGSSHFGSYGALSTIIEAAYQFGKMADFDISAYLFSAQGSYSFGSSSLGAGADILSGSDESLKVKSFDPGFGTNHKFYGYMDYFINIPGNTDMRGLNDFYLFWNYQPKDCDWEASINLHHFMLNQPAKYTTVFGPNLTQQVTEFSTFGQEIDVTIKYKFIKGTTLTWGGSVFLPGDYMKEIFSRQGIKKEDPAFWSYVMITSAIN